VPLRATGMDLTPCVSWPELGAEFVVIFSVIDAVSLIPRKSVAPCYEPVWLRWRRVRWCHVDQRFYASRHRQSTSIVMLPHGDCACLAARRTQSCLMWPAAARDGPAAVRPPRVDRPA